MTTTLLHGDCRNVLPTLPAESVHCCVTSPPYWGLRDYGHADQIGLERTPAEYVDALVGVFREARRVLRADGTLWLNLGDSYASDTKGSGGSNASSSTLGVSASGEVRMNTNGKQLGMDRQHFKARRVQHGIKPKNLCGIPWRVALALQADGWYLRSDIIWSKPNPMPESVTDRPTKAHEYVFLLSKSASYYYDADAIAEVTRGEVTRGEVTRGEAVGAARGCNGRGPDRDGNFGASVTRNRRTVWTIATQPYSGAHFAVMPPDLVTPCILAGSPLGGTVIDPFGGSGTVGEVAAALGRNSVLVELNAAYVELAKVRTRQESLFAGLGVVT